MAGRNAGYCFLPEIMLQFIMQNCVKGGCSMCSCNVFCQFFCSLFLVFAVAFNTLSNRLGKDDIFETDTCPFEWCVEETTTKKPAPRPSTTKPTTTKPTTTSTTRQPGPTTEILDARQVSLGIFGGYGDDIINGTAPASDGGYVICGTTTSRDGDFSGLYQSGWKSPYSFVARYSKTGELVWIKAFGSTYSAVVLEDVCVLDNGTIIAVGYTQATDYAANSESAGTIDAIILKLNSNGYLSAKKSLGGKNTDMFNCVESMGTSFVAGGKSYSVTGDFTHLEGDSAILMRFDSNLAVEWQTKFHGEAASTIGGVATDDDGNIFATCITSATKGDYADYNNTGGYADTLVVKYNSSGEMEWGHMISSTGRDEFGSIAPDGKGGCVVAGQYELIPSQVPDGSLSGLHHCGNIDALVFGIGSDGSRKWVKILSGIENDFITDIVYTNGGYAVVGYTESYNREFSEVGNEGLHDGFVSFLNANGEVVKTFTQAGSDDDMAECVVGTNLGTVCVMGKTKSIDVDFELNMYSPEIYMGYMATYQIN